MVKNSYFVILPQEVAISWGLEQGKLVDVELDEDKLILRNHNYED